MSADLLYFRIAQMPTYQDLEIFSGRQEQQQRQQQHNQLLYPLRIRAG